MSTFSEIWHATPPAIRDFYVNFAKQHTTLRNRWSNGIPEFPYEYFNYQVYSFMRPVGRDIAYSQWMWHLAEWGYIKPEHIEWSFHGTHTWQGPMPVRGVANFPTWEDQFIDVPDFCINYPREKRKVPRSYWTGKPRHRRNL